MTPTEYIQNCLDKLKVSNEPSTKLTGSDLVDEIKRLALSKKFRKYSATPKLIEHIVNAVEMNIKDNQPIKFVFFNGAYKLWRLEESPNSDWAELFTLIYITKWLKPICEIYKPGVEFDFFMDDYIVSKLNNVEFSDVEAYIKSFNELFSFIKPYQPANLKMTLTPVSSQFDSQEEFETLLSEGMIDYRKENPEPVFVSDSLKNSIDLNVKVTNEQLEDPLWRERVWDLHKVYIPIKKKSGYSDQNDKIKVFTQPFTSGMSVSIGTTKTSIAKFWVGVGALKKRNDSYIETVLSLKQENSSNFDIVSVTIEGLTGKNFETIRVIN